MIVVVVDDDAFVVSCFLFRAPVTVTGAGLDHESRLMSVRMLGLNRGGVNSRYCNT